MIMEVELKLTDSDSTKIMTVLLDSIPRKDEIISIEENENVIGNYKVISIIHPLVKIKGSLYTKRIIKIKAHLIP